MTAQVDAVVYFYIQDPVASVMQAENVRNSTFKIAQGTLRNILGTKTLAQMLSDREEMNENLNVSERELLLEDILTRGLFRLCVAISPITKSLHALRMAKMCSNILLSYLIFAKSFRDVIVSCHCLHTSRV